MPSARAPSTSSSTESPNIAASSGSTPSRPSTAREMVGAGLLVVRELGVALQVRDRRVARLVVARRIEAQSEALPEQPVALRPEVGPGLRKREVDVEENRARRRHTRDGHRYAAGCLLASDG